MNQPKEILLKRITVVCLSVLSLTEIVVSGELKGTGFLWVFYGFYKMN